MNKLLLTSLSIILFVLLLLAGVFYFVFSQSGNSMIGAYIQKETQKAIGLPVEVHKFKLEAGKAQLIMRINQRMSVEVVTNYDILGQSFSGIYRVKADNFRYEKMLLRQADVSGQFKGKIEDGNEFKTTNHGFLSISKTMLNDNMRTKPTIKISTFSNAIVLSAL